MDAANFSGKFTCQESHAKCGLRIHVGRNDSCEAVKQTWKGPFRNRAESRPKTVNDFLRGKNVDPDE